MNAELIDVRRNITQTNAQIVILQNEVAVLEAEKAAAGDGKVNAKYNKTALFFLNRNKAV